jgi:hypothetical protein
VNCSRQRQARRQWQLRHEVKKREGDDESGDAKLTIADETMQRPGCTGFSVLNKSGRIAVDEEHQACIYQAGHDLIG